MINKNKQTTQKILFYFLVLIVSAIYVHVRIENSLFIREPRASFGDTHEYTDLAFTPIFSETFWIALRPPVIPLLYKLTVGGHSEISKFQLWFSILSWCILGLSVMSTIKFYPFRFIAFTTILAFSLSEKIIMWDYIILAESLSLSIIALFSASAVVLLSKRSKMNLLLFFTAAIMFAFARDDFAYYILMLSAISFFLLFFTKSWRYPLLTGMIFATIFLISNAIASSSFRWERPLLNTISIRVLSTPQYLAYFIERGMPVNEALLERNGKPLHADDNALIVDPRLDKFRSWVHTNGKNEYIRFLWFYKADTFQNIFNHIGDVFSPDVYYYTATRFRPIIADARISELLFPMKFGFLFFLLANLMAAAFSVVAIFENKITWLLPISLILLTYPQALMVWSADANDVARHAKYHNVMMRLGVWILVIFIFDFAVEKFKKSTFARKGTMKY